LVCKDARKVESGKSGKAGRSGGVSARPLKNVQFCPRVKEKFVRATLGLPTQRVGPRFESDLSAVPACPVETADRPQHRQAPRLGKRERFSKVSMGIWLACFTGLY